MSNAPIDPRIEAVFDAWDNQDADRAIEQFANDGRFYEIPRGEEFSKAEFREYLAEGVFELFPDYSVEQTQVLTTHHWATVIEWSFSGTPSGENGDTPSTREPITQPMLSIITVSDDGITSWRDFFDGHALNEKLDRS